MYYHFLHKILAKLPTMLQKTLKKLVKLNNMLQETLKKLDAIMNVQ